MNLLSKDVLHFKRRETLKDNFNYSSHADWPGCPWLSRIRISRFGFIHSWKMLTADFFLCVRIIFLSTYSRIFSCQVSSHEKWWFIAFEWLLKKQLNSMKQIKKCQVKRNLFVSLAWQKNDKIWQRQKCFGSRNSASTF